MSLPRALFFPLVVFVVSVVTFCTSNELLWCSLFLLWHIQSKCLEIYVENSVKLMKHQNKSEKSKSKAPESIFTIMFSFVFLFID